MVPKISNSKKLKFYKMSKKKQHKTVVSPNSIWEEGKQSFTYHWEGFPLTTAVMSLAQSTTHPLPSPGFALSGSKV